MQTLMLFMSLALLLVISFNYKKYPRNNFGDIFYMDISGTSTLTDTRGRRTVAICFFVKLFSLYFRGFRRLVAGALVFIKCLFVAFVRNSLQIVSAGLIAMLKKPASACCIAMGGAVFSPWAIGAISFVPSFNRVF